MKIAICISGLPRFSAHFDTFLNNISGYSQIDWFFYFWNDFKDFYVPANWPVHSEEESYLKILKNLPSNNFIRHLSINQMPELTLQRDTLEEHCRHSHPPLRLLYQWLSVKCCNQKREEYEKNNGAYDLVIKFRGEYGLNSKLDFNLVQQYLNTYNNVILTPGNHRVPICDLLAIGSSSNMSVYNNLYDRLYEYYDQGVRFHPETILAHHCYVNGLQCPMTDIDVFGTVKIHKSVTEIPDEYWGRWN